MLLKIIVSSEKLEISQKPEKGVEGSVNVYSHKMWHTKHLPITYSKWVFISPSLCLQSSRTRQAVAFRNHRKMLPWSEASCSIWGKFLGFKMQTFSRHPCFPGPTCASGPCWRAGMTWVGVLTLLLAHSNIYPTTPGDFLLCKAVNGQQKNWHAQHSPWVFLQVGKWMI